MDKKQLSVDAIKAEYDRLYEILSPSEVVINIYARETAHQEIMMKKYGRFVAHFEMEYDSIVKLIHHLNYVEKKHWPSQRSTQYLLLAANLKSLFSSFDRLIKGYYDDALILIRPCFEAFIKIIAISCFPDDAWPLIYPGKFANGKKFNLTNFINQDLKLNWSQYEWLSALIHANAPGAFLKLKDIVEKKNTPITLSFPYDDDAATRAINHLVFVNYTFLKLLAETMVIKPDGSLTTNLLDIAKKLIFLSRQSVSMHPKPYWPEISKDADDLIELIRTDQVELSWKERWTVIRTV